jgi:hypothetical protein
MTLAFGFAAFCDEQVFQRRMLSLCRQNDIRSGWWTLFMHEGQFSC